MKFSCKRNSLLICLLVNGLLVNLAGSKAADADVMPPFPEGPPAVVQPQCGKDHVYVFMVNGMTVMPHLAGSMTRLADVIPRHGYYSQSATHYSRKAFQDQIRCIYRQDPQAQIVLIGYTPGASIIHSMAHTLANEGIPIALMVYLDGHTLTNNFNDRPCNARRVMCVTSTGHVLRGARFCQADATVEIGNSRHLSVPRNDATVNLLLCELDALAAACVPPPVVVDHAAP